MLISVIIPTFNEAEQLPATLEAIGALPGIQEILVVDAGSSDSTRQVAQSAGARVVCCRRRQKAAQLNAGAAEADGEVLLFLHADTRIPPRAWNGIAEVLSRDQGVVGGGFVRFFDRESFWLRATCHLAAWRGRLTGLFLGDQAIFVRRTIFEEVEGFRDMDVFEDYDLCSRMKQKGRLLALEPAIVSSGRRFDRGVIRISLNDFRLTVGYLVRSLLGS